MINVIGKVGVLVPLLVLPARAQAQITEVKTQPQQAGRTFYMATAASGGSMNNDGTKEKPFSQLKQFSDIANPGDILLIRGGLYTDCWGTTMTRSGSGAGGYITYRNYPGETPILDGQNDSKRQSVCFYSFNDNYLAYVRIQGLVLRHWTRSGISLGANYKDKTQTNDHLDIRYNVVDSCGQNGIVLAFGNDNTVQYNMVSRTGYDPNMGSWSSNINLIEMTGRNNVVDSNISFQSIDVSSNHTDGNGLILDMSSENGLQGGIVATNNLLFWNGGAGIALTKSGNASFTNNTLWENGCESSYIHQGVGFVTWDAHDFTFQNNIAFQSQGVGIKLDKAYPQGLMQHNLASVKGKSLASPFAAPQSARFDLQANSLAKGKGDNASAPRFGLWFDPKIIRLEPKDQPVSWFRYAPDLTYIARRGGMEKCLGPAVRPAGKNADLGAIVSRKN